MKSITEKIGAFRAAMKSEGIAAYIVPGTDPHASEYITDHWKERVWISGFTGSAGTIVVGLEKAGLWTDSRYFLQSSIELKDTGIDLMKQGVPGTPEISKWLTLELKAGDKVGINPQMFSVNAYADLKRVLDMAGIDIVFTDLPKKLWDDRPALPKDPFFVFDTQYSGISTTDKLVKLRAELKEMHSETFILSALDDIAWLFNIRGKDVSYNPVVIAYALVDGNQTSIFIDSDKLTAETKAYFASQNVEVKAYEAIYDAIAAITPGKRVLIDGAKLNQSLFAKIPKSCSIVNTMSPVFKLKGVKNEVELSGIRKAMAKDGVALTRFFMWLEEAVKTGKETEVSVNKKLYEFRSKQDGFMGESFGTIAGYGPHGAIVHYSATEASASTLHPENIFLLDSGAQFLDGTTDITRTVAFGVPSVQQKIDYTLVLKGHIALATVKFPVATRGSQLDILARKAMWDLGINYGHGTGHGVGHFLNVHEGPQNIRMDENPTVLVEGMVISNEPGLYRDGQYGIRTENLIHVIPAEKTDFGQFLQFETLTLFPIDQVLIDVELLEDKEIEWLNWYHKKVYDTLSPFLDENEREWLSSKCAMLKK